MRITDKYVFFWNGIYSQWYPCDFHLDGYDYTCTEQWMMHQKALLFKDEITAKKIMQTDSPKDQKSLGRQVRNFNSEVWQKSCVQIVYRGNLAKFSQNESLKNQLLLTGDRMIVEASPYDQIWGIGLSENDAGIENPMNWKGQNLLGLVIMMVRHHLK